MALSKAEIAEGIAIKKRLSKLVKKSGDKSLMKADKAYHERLRRFVVVDRGEEDLLTVMGGDT